MDRRLVSGIFLFFILAIINPAAAQKPGRVSLKFSPQFLLINGYHFEIEKALGGSKQRSIAFAPHFYSGKTTLADAFTGRNSGLGTSEIKGFGGEILYKVSGPEVKDAPNELITITYGLNFHRFELSFMEEGWVEVPGHDGLNYLEKQPKPFRETINRLGGVVLVGPKSKYITDRLFADLYIGMGVSYSSSKTDFFETRYHVNFLDYGNSGAYFLTGLKLGLVLW